MKGKINYIIISVMVFLFAATAVYLRWDYLPISALSGTIEKDPLWDVDLVSDDVGKVKDILSQRFYYYAKGRQNFVFISEDKQYVLKLINHDRFRYPSFFYKIPMPSFFDAIRKAKIAKKEKRPQMYFSGYKLAYDKMQKETGLVYIHLNPTTCFNQKFSLLTKTKKFFQMDMDKTRFLLQKKGKRLYPYLDNQYKKFHEEGLKNAIDKLLITLQKRCEEKIVDDDLNIGNNIGFFEDQPLFFDLGKWYYDQNILSYREMVKSTKFFRRWLKHHYPQVLSYFDERLKIMAKEDVSP
jgi:hypothetical protein